MSGPTKAGFVEGVHYIVAESGCHQWIRATSHDGYGFAEVDKKHIYAHRASWQEVHGLIQNDMTVDHLCFNPGCINVEHLRLLDHLTNSRLQRSAFKTHCVNGHEFTPENTYRRPIENRRQCRACKAAGVRRYQARKAAA